MTTIQRTYDELFMVVINSGYIITEHVSSVLPFRDKDRTLKLKAYRDAVLKFYDYKCFICGYNNFVDIHHIIHKSSGGTDQIDNLVLLCPNHHKEWHYYENTFSVGVKCEPSSRANRAMNMDYSIPEKCINGNISPFIERLKEIGIPKDE